MVRNQLLDWGSEMADKYILMKSYFKNVLFLGFFFICLSAGIKAEQSLRNKIGEMLIVGFCEDTFHENSEIAKNIEKNHIGGVILYSGCGLGGKVHENIKSPSQLRALISGLQVYALRNRLSDEGPLFIAIDQEGGWVSRLPREKGFIQQNISARDLGVMNDVDKTYFYSVSLGEYLWGLGINLNFAPVVDLAVNYDNFIFKRRRCFSGDAAGLYRHSSAFIKGMHQSRIITTLKHFPGHGSSAGDSHKGIVDVSNTWTKVELEPYVKFIDDGYCDMIMTAHVINRKLDEEGSVRNMLGEEGPIPATLSKKMLTGLLRNQMGFQGVIVSDDMSMGGIADQYLFEDALKYSINAGVDVLILANHSDDRTVEAIDTIERLVKKGEISVERIDEAYGRILRLKSRVLDIGGYALPSPVPGARLWTCLCCGDSEMGRGF